MLDMYSNNKQLLSQIACMGNFITLAIMHLSFNMPLDYSQYINLTSYRTQNNNGCLVIKCYQTHSDITT